MAEDKKPKPPLPTPSPALQLLSIREVVERIGVGRTTIYRWMDKGKFPKPLKLSDSSNRWRESDLAAWLDSHDKSKAA